MFDQCELLGVDDFVLGAAVHAWAEPVIDTVGGDEDRWTGVCTRFGELAPESLPSRMRVVVIFGAEKHKVFQCGGFLQRKVLRGRVVEFESRKDRFVRICGAGEE